MKLATIFLIATIVHVSAATMAQKITLKSSNLSYKQLFKEVRKQTGYSVIWESEKFNSDELISVDFNGSSITIVFDKVIKNRGYSYLIEDSTIIIQNQKSSSLTAETNFKKIDVTGKVVDENGVPLNGASVVRKSDGKGINTLVDGTFLLKNVDESEILLVRFVGYDVREIAAAKELGTIKLKIASNELDAVQIQAYGKTSKRLSLSNITSVKAKDIENQIVSNPLLALQGRVAGLQIQQVSGNAGASVIVKIQGTSSLSASSTPFYVVDGVPYPGSTMKLVGNSKTWGDADFSLQGEGYGSPLAYLNPSDIESIEILKDADATSIYGSRAANGAIIITTKKGQPGALNVNFTVQSGWDKVPKTTEFVSTQQYLELRREAYFNGNQVISQGTYDLDGTWDQNKYTDWQKELIRTQNYSNANLSVSGGTINSNYRVALTANRQGSPYGQEFRNDNIAFSTSLNAASANQKFKVGLIFNYLNANNNLPNLGNALEGGDFISTLTPNAPDIYNSDGSINWAPDQNGTPTFEFNPVARFLSNPFEVKTNNLISNLDISYNLIKGLDFSTNIGYNRSQQQEFSADLFAAIAPIYHVGNFRSGSYRFTQQNSLIIEPKISYGHQFGAHRIKVLLGTTYNQSQGETSGIVGYGHNSDLQVKNLNAAASFNQTGAYYSAYKYNAIFSRLEYIYNDKYLFSLSARRDGSTRFGPANRFGNFGSIAAGWIISEEKWLKSNAKWLDFLKLKTSYGITGNDAIGDYRFMDLYFSTSAGVPYQGIVGLASQNLYNENLQWEEKKSLNVGLEAAIFKERLTFGVNYNINRSSNLLQELTLPVTAGFSKVLVNFDAVVENTGWEIVFGGTVVKSKQFQWTISSNFTIPKNKLASLANIERIPGAAFIYQVGEPLGSLLSRNYLGVNPLTGMEVLEDVNGNPVDRNGLVSQMAFKRINLTSPYYAGLQTGFKLGNFNLELSIDYMKQLKPRYFFENSRPGAEAFNQPSFAYTADRWQFPGDIAVIQKYSVLNPFGQMTNSVQNYEDATYIRLNNAAFSWSVPDRWAKTMGLKVASLGINVQNLLTLSKYAGSNPITGAKAMPPSRTIVAKLNASF